MVDGARRAGSAPSVRQNRARARRPFPMRASCASAHVGEGAFSSSRDTVRARRVRAPRAYSRARVERRASSVVALTTARRASALVVGAVGDDDDDDDARAPRRRRRDVSTSAMSDVVASGDDDDDDGSSRLGQTRVQRAVDSLRTKTWRRAKKNFKKLPLALISLLVGFSVCALLPHPESPQDAFISFTIILLAEFASSVLYGDENQGGILRWVREGDWLPTVLNCLKIGVLYGLFCDGFKVGS